MKFAVIESGGKQYRVSAGSKIRVEKLDANEGANFSFDKVLLVAEQRGLNADLRGKEWDVKVGTPYISGVKVEGKVLRQARDRKKIIFKYHSKTRYHKKKGHRQHFTEIEIVKT
ncbi:MAG: 50S ribosomal protein L21 [Patescibacteria group bacterium]